MDYLVHHGIIGQKWGVRRFQNEDGSLKPAGEKRYSRSDKIREARAMQDEYYKREKNIRKALDERENTYWDLMNRQDKNGNYLYDQGDPRLYKTKEYKVAEKKYDDAIKYADEALKGHSFSEINKLASKKTGGEIAKKILGGVAGGLAFSGTLVGTAYLSAKLGK